MDKSPLVIKSKIEELTRLSLNWHTPASGVDYIVVVLPIQHHEVVAGWFIANGYKDKEYIIVGDSAVIGIDSKMKRTMCFISSVPLSGQGINL